MLPEIEKAYGVLGLRPGAPIVIGLVLFLSLLLVVLTFALL